MIDIVRAKFIGKGGVINEGVLDQKINFLVKQVTKNVNLTNQNCCVITDDCPFTNEQLMNHRSLILKNIENGLSILNFVPQDMHSAKISGHKFLLAGLREQCLDLPDYYRYLQHEAEEGAFNNLVQAQNPIDHASSGVDAVFNESLLALRNEAIS